jgi:hypothetical protein
MALNKDEKALMLALKDPRFPMSCVEGTFKGERAVFICLMDAADNGRGYDMTPIAMLLREEDMPHVRGHEDEAPGDNSPKIILAKD